MLSYVEISFKSYFYNCQLQSIEISNNSSVSNHCFKSIRNHIREISKNWSRQKLLHEQAIIAAFPYETGAKISASHVLVLRIFSTEPAVVESDLRFFFF